MGILVNILRAQDGEIKKLSLLVLKNVGLPIKFNLINEIKIFFTYNIINKNLMMINSLDLFEKVKVKKCVKMCAFTTLYSCSSRVSNCYKQEEHNKRIVPDNSI